VPSAFPSRAIRKPVAQAVGLSATRANDVHYAARAYARPRDALAATLDQTVEARRCRGDGHFSTVLCGLVDATAHRVGTSDTAAPGEATHAGITDGLYNSFRTLPDIGLGLGRRVAFRAFDSLDDFLRLDKAAPRTQRAEIAQRGA
jgi:hypothetical protein